MQIKTIIIFIAVTLGVLLGVGGLLWQFGGNIDKPIADIAGESTHKMGNGPVQIVEFSDFQCPACFTVQEPLKQMLKQYEGKITFVYRYFPLVSIHKNAMISAQAAEAAGLQDKFWQMHDKLFATQGVWEDLADPREIFANYAEELEMDRLKFVNDIDSQGVKDAINADLLSANKHALGGTPTFFVNGVKTEFAQLEAKMQSL